MTSPSRNPFTLTKSNDLSDEQIEALWVDVTDKDNALISMVRPASPMPMMILGGKGSGKTHLMRYCSFGVQKLRYSREGISISEGIRRDGYLGLYFRCEGLNASRFSGKEIKEEAWRDLFAFYVELWLSQEMLKVINELFVEQSVSESVESTVCEQIGELFDTDQPTAATLLEIVEHLKKIQRSLDFEVNNAAFTGKVDVRVCITRGRLIFGIPRIVSKLEILAKVLFVYQLDEFENFSASQQEYINTLVREREAPATFKIGARIYGIKTRVTLSDGEENIKDSEYESLRLDETFRRNEKVYNALAKALVVRRIEEGIFNGPNRIGAEQWLEKIGTQFEEQSTDWKSESFIQLLGRSADMERAHFRNLRRKLIQGNESKCTPGVVSNPDIQTVIEGLSCPKYPLLEKANLLEFYQAWSDGKDLSKTARDISKDCAAFIEGRRDSKYSQSLQHYKSDLIAQLVRENKGKQLYLGLDNFIKMSEGLPRVLITLLKHVCDWAIFNGEKVFQGGKITIDSQQKGTLEASEWFLNSMRKAGSDGVAIRTSIDRLADLFRINRFSDKPIECSLIAFSFSPGGISPEARRILQMAEARSFLLNIAGGQKERNSEQVTTKLQLNRMLSPRWELPIARRGVVPLSAREIDAIFDPAKETEFRAIRSEWEAKMTAPYFGRRPKKTRSEQGKLL